MSRHPLGSGLISGAKHILRFPEPIPPVSRFTSFHNGKEFITSHGRLLLLFANGERPSLDNIPFAVSRSKCGNLFPH
jgi:hypothetical protein